MSVDVRPRSKALPLRAELGRQLRRRRTQGTFIVLTALPLILVLAFWLGDDETDSGARGFVDLAQESGANLVVFALFASTGFLFIVIVALFAGDTVPSEASWSSLRYLLAAPVRRGRLLRQKLIVAALSSMAALIFLPAWTLLVGGIAYGWGPYVGPTGDQLTLGQFAVRLVIIVGYLLVDLATVAAFAFMLGVLTDAPLAAVGGAVLLMILSAILDSITALGGIRQGLPGHYAYAWADALAPTVNFSDMITGALVVGRLRHRADRLRRLALRPEGHHQLARVGWYLLQMLTEEGLDPAPGVSRGCRIRAGVADLHQRAEHQGSVAGVVQEAVPGRRVHLDVGRDLPLGECRLEPRHVLDAAAVPAAIAGHDRAGIRAAPRLRPRAPRRSSPTPRRSHPRRPTTRTRRPCRSRSPRPVRCTVGRPAPPGGPPRSARTADPCAPSTPERSTRCSAATNPRRADPAPAPDNPPPPAAPPAGAARRPPPRLRAASPPPARARHPQAGSSRRAGRRCGCPR